MKFSNILLSVLLHAGVVAGGLYGLRHCDETEIVDEQIEPMFFEVLEECTVAATEPTEPVKPPQQTVIETVPAVPKSTRPVDENSVRTEFSGLMESENNERKTADTSVVEPLIVENSVRTEIDDELEAEEECEEALAVNKEEIGAEKEKKEDIEEEKQPEKVQETQETREAREECEDVKPVEQEQAKIVSAPAALNRIVPVYPRSARRRGREGIVTLEISVSGAGEVSDAVVVGGSGYKDLDSAAVSAVRTARFAPATEDGVPVCGRLRLTFEFKLR